MAKRYPRSVTAVIATIAIILSACGGSEPGPAGTLIFATSDTFPENLLPLIGAGSSTAVGNIMIRILPAPFRIMPNFTVVPDGDLVVGQPSLEVTSTGQVVTYQINPDAVWSDGAQITADDFEFTWKLQRSLDPADGGCPALVGSVGYDQIESVAGSDAGKTVRVTYASPFPDWKSLFTLYPKHVLDTGNDAANCAALTRGWPIKGGIPQAVSGGPWQLLSTNIDAKSQSVTLTPNPRWYGAPPRLQRIIYETVGREPSVLAAALKSGEADLVSAIPALDTINQIRSLAPGVVSETDLGLAFEHIDLNTTNVHLRKPEVRQAFALALDRAAIVAATAGQLDSRLTVLNNRFYVSNQPQYGDTAPPRYNSQDLAGAERLLESVGYQRGADGVYAHPTDGRLALRLSTLPDVPLFAATIEVIAAELRQAGFAIEPVVDRDIFGAADRPTSLASHGFDVALFAWIDSPFVSQNAPLYRTDGAQNFAGVRDPTVDRLLDQLSTELDEQRSADLANAVDRMLWEDLVTIPLCQLPIFTAWNSTFRGISPNATSSGPLWNSDKIAQTG